MNSDPTEILLDAVEARVAASLVEKSVTTPDYHPLSLNALVNACNQSSNRDPVMTLGEAAVRRAVELLRQKRLVFVFEGATNRVAKYGSKLAETLSLSPAEVAVLCELMLRGPQTVGELRGRAARMHTFASLGEVEAALQALAARPGQPLAVRLPRQAGFKESRYAHLLAGPPPIEAPAPAAKTAPGGSEPAGERLAQLEAEVAELRREVTELKARFIEHRPPPV
jgi:hypothetical protein